MTEHEISDAKRKKILVRCPLCRLPHRKPAADYPIADRAYEYNKGVRAAVELTLGFQKGLLTPKDNPYYHERNGGVNEGNNLIRHSS